MVKKESPSRAAEGPRQAEGAGRTVVFGMDIPCAGDRKDNARNLGVGNAVPGVPAGAMPKARARRGGIAAFGGWNAEDGVPYG